MGMIKYFSSGSSDTAQWSAISSELFTIKKTLVVGDFVIIKVNYEKATNFGGDKVLVYKGYSLDYVLKQKILDPHFVEKGFGPFARFAPTLEGLEAAISLAEGLNNE